MIRMLENSPQSFELLLGDMQSNSKYTEKVKRMQSLSEHKKQANAPTFIKVGINFGEYFPSSKKAEEEEKETCRSEGLHDIEQAFDNHDYDYYFKAQNNLTPKYKS